MLWLTWDDFSSKTLYETWLTWWTAQTDLSHTSMQRWSPTGHQRGSTTLSCPGYWGWSKTEQKTKSICIFFVSSQVIICVYVCAKAVLETISFGFESRVRREEGVVRIKNKSTCSWVHIMTRTWTCGLRLTILWASQFFSCSLGLVVDQDHKIMS